MSGGHFDYAQYRIQDIITAINEFIGSKDNEFSDKTISEIRRGVKILRMASVYAQRIDWLISGDDGEDEFHKRLSEELGKIVKDYEP